MLLQLIVIASLAAVASAEQCGCKAEDVPLLPTPDPETGLVDGDMRLDAINYMEILGMRNVRTGRLWPNRILHYRVSNGNERAVAKALDELEKATSGCVRFRKRTNQSGYVDVIKGYGCSSYIGYRNQRRTLSLDDGCYSTGTIQHEFLHALGFYHEQSRPDRDRHVTIHWRNIRSRSCGNFYKGGSLPRNYPGYDLRSVMHYRGTSSSCPRGRTTISARNGGTVGGSRLTSTDVRKIRVVYGC